MVYLRSLSVVMVLLFLPQAGAIRPHVIYGDDDRKDYYQITDPAVQALADATVSLVRASSLEENGEWTQLITVPYNQKKPVCPSERFYDQQTLGYCSGFLVAPDIVVTAGHCMMSQTACNSTRFVFGFKVDQTLQSPNAVRTEHVFSCKKLVHSVLKLGAEDFAVIQLDRPVTHVRPLKFRREGRIQPGEPVRVIGNPVGLPIKLADNAYVLNVKDTFFMTNTDSYVGNSGSAVLHALTDEVEGVLVRGNRDFEIKDGCEVSIRCPANAVDCRGEDVTLFELILPFLYLTDN